jgi:hypothetical protein
MLDCHIAAFLIKPGRVMSRKLRTLTLAHYWLLEAVDSPYVAGRPPAYSDTAFAVFILSMHPAVTRWLLMHDRIMEAAFKAWGWRYKGLNIIGDMRAFQNYWDAFTARPGVWETKSSGRASCLPSSINVAWTLMGKVSERRAWSMPMPLALAYFTAENERNGAEYKTEHDAYLKSLNAQPKEEDGNG